MFEKAVKIVSPSVFGFLGSAGIPNQDNIGTCFFISDKIILTAAHCCHLGQVLTQPLVKSFSIFLLNSPNNSQLQFFNAILISIDDAIDVAVLEVKNFTAPGLSSTKKPIEISKPVGEIALFLLSASQGSTIYNQTNFAHSTISQICYPDFMIDCFNYPGASGAPVFDVEGNVVGMQHRNVIIQNQIACFSIIVHIDAIKLFLSTVNISF